MPAARALGQRRASQKGLRSGKSELRARSPKTGRPEPPSCSRAGAQQKSNGPKPSRSTLLAAADQHALTRPSQPSGRTFKWRSRALLTSTSRALTAHWCGV
ncbi:hypothetical protein V5799_017683 [Amblyomma americanum]|uniref:Uncharacterized protein n=1 Tax=Amblyomma americanum TaxID=6943 RepID=A0AAQ4F1H7_AMBAM